MAQTGYTPILIYASGTTGNTPSASNLTSSSSGAELALNYFDGKLFYKDNTGTVQVLAGKGGTGVVAGSNTQVQFNNNGVFGASSGMTWNGTRLTVTDFADSSLTSGRVTFAGAGGNLSDAAGLTWDGTNFTATQVRSSNLTSGRVTYAGASGLLQDSANLTFNGTSLTLAATSARILGDFTNATVTSRLSFQTTTANSTTGIYALPSGTSTAASWQATNASDPTNASKILIATNGSTDVQLVSGRNGSGTYLPLTFYTNGSEQLRLDTSGNMGLGVTPSAWSGAKAIQVNRAGAISALSGSDGLNMTANSYYNGTNWIYAVSYFATRYQSDDGQHRWFNAASGTAGNAITFTQAMTLNASGQLLLGTTSAIGGENLTIGNGSGSTYTSTYFNAGSGGNSLVGRVSGSNTWFIGDTVAAIGSGTGMVNYVYGANPWLVYTNNAERARIDSSGNLLVGKTASDTSSSGVQIYNTSGTYGRINLIKSASGTVDALANYYSGTYVGGLTYSNTATAIVTSSDIRLKKDIVDAGSASTKIDQIRIVSHGWKHDDDVVEFGVIAQELNSVVPQAVVAGDAGEEIEKTWGVDYSKLIPILIKAHQELKAEFDAYKALHP